MFPSCGWGALGLGLGGAGACQRCLVLGLSLACPFPHLSRGKNQKKKAPTSGPRQPPQRTPAVTRSDPSPGPIHLRFCDVSHSLTSHAYPCKVLWPCFAVCSGWRWIAAPRLWDCDLRTPTRVASPAAIHPSAHPTSASGLRAAILCMPCGLHGPRPTPPQQLWLVGLAATATPMVLSWLGHVCRLAAMQGPAEPPGAPADPSKGFFHHALWALRAIYHVCAVGALAGITC